MAKILSARAETGNGPDPLLVAMIDADPKVEWPQPGAVSADPVLARDPALAALEEAWRAGLLVENEPT